MLVILDGRDLVIGNYVISTLELVHWKDYICTNK